MNTPQKTIKGYCFRRRCDLCGTLMSLAVDTGERCVLVCLQCGEEYSFAAKEP